MDDSSGKNVFTISPGHAFIDSLASGILERYGKNPESLVDITVLLPTRRACRALGEAFLRVTNGTPTVLPAISPIGDVDEDELALVSSQEKDSFLGTELTVAVSDLHRKLLLARLIMAEDEAIFISQALLLAEQLCRFLDEMQTERVDFRELKSLVPARYARHWQRTLSFLQILTGHWPNILSELGCIDPADRRNRLINAQIKLWDEKPPVKPVIAAGSTGSIPATADLIRCITNLEFGSVVLPGLDIAMDRKSVCALAPSHPQYGMLRLLSSMDISLREVEEWTLNSSTKPISGQLRFFAINKALRPPSIIASEMTESDLAQAFKGVSRVNCANLQQEALTISLILREVLEHPGQTAALVTPDRRLARRVVTELHRWKIEINDSGGTPLHLTSLGIFLILTADLARKESSFIQVFAALKHSLSAAGNNPEFFKEWVCAIELAVLKAPRPAAGLTGLLAVLENFNANLEADTFSEIVEAASKFSQLMGRSKVRVVELLQAHIQFAEHMARSDIKSGSERLWSGEEGETGAILISNLQAAAETFPQINGHEWPDLFKTLLKGCVVRPNHGQHPRLSIWGLLEARLQQADLMILGGLNEGVWPTILSPDPWMSRPMRTQLGLTSNERRIGLAAHDFVQGFAAPRVVLTRSTRVDGSPTVPARWLARIDTLLSSTKAGEKVRDNWLKEQTRWIKWQRQLDSRLPRVLTLPPFAIPPVDARPNSLSVTEIETLIRDPYAIYAKKILRLTSLKPIDAGPNAADRGSMIHKIVERFFTQIGAGPIPENALNLLIDIGSEEFSAWFDVPGVRTFWWPRFERLAQWIVDIEKQRDHYVVKRSTEVSGDLFIDHSSTRPFQLKGRADRIDTLADGTCQIIDYKTGTLPSKTEVNRGVALQLPLEAVMLEQQAFSTIQSKSINALIYMHLTGGNPPGSIRDAGENPGQLAKLALERLRTLIDYYENPKNGYLARPNSLVAPEFSDYDDLERVKGWAAGRNRE